MKRPGRRPVDLEALIDRMLIVIAARGPIGYWDLFRIIGGGRVPFDRALEALVENDDVCEWYRETRRGRGRRALYGIRGKREVLSDYTGVPVTRAQVEEWLSNPRKPR